MNTKIITNKENEAENIIKKAKEKAEEILFQSNLLEAIEQEANKIKKQVFYECSKIKKENGIPNKLFSTYKYCNHIYDEYWFIIPKGADLGYIADSSGKALTDKISDFENDIAEVKLNGIKFKIDRQGNRIVD